VLEPDNPAMNPAKIAVGPQLGRQFLQQLSGVGAGRLPSNLGAEFEGEQLLFAVGTQAEDVGATGGLECGGGRVGVDCAQTAQQLVDLHHPKGVAAKVLANATRRKVLLLCISTTIPSAKSDSYNLTIKFLCLR
jgi:hypothetical protein